VVPFYHDQAEIDGARLAMMWHTIFGAPPPQLAGRRECARRPSAG
jgi:hypothetical protein